MTLVEIETLRPTNGKEGREHDEFDGQTELKENDHDRSKAEQQLNSMVAVAMDSLTNELHTIAPRELGRTKATVS